MNEIETIAVPAKLFWGFLLGAFSLFAALVRHAMRTRALKVEIKAAAEQLPGIVRGLAEERGMESILPPAPRKKLTTLTGVETVRAAIREGHRILNTRERATNLPSERPFARLQPTDETPPEPVVERRRSTPGHGNVVPFLGLPEDRAEDPELPPTDPHPSTDQPKKR